MIYRFEILSITGLFEGWAHTPDEMKEKYKAEYPGEPEPFVFLCGESPLALSYVDYQYAIERGLNADQIRVVDHFLAGEMQP